MACEYCNGNESIFERDEDVCEIDGRRLVARVMAMGMLFGSLGLMNHGFSASINYCPMCGERLGDPE